jgi:hypothetical protein
MNRRRAPTTAMFAVGASAVAVFALVLALTAPDYDAQRQAQRERGPGPRPDLDRHFASRPVKRAARREIARVARSFAAAYLRWDAGRRTRAVARTLRRLSSPALWADLQLQGDRPSARRWHRTVAVRLEVALGSDWRWRAPLASAERGGRYLGTLVLAYTATGARVTAVHR